MAVHGRVGRDKGRGAVERESLCSPARQSSYDLHLSVRRCGRRQRSAFVMVLRSLPE